MAVPLHYFMDPSSYFPLHSTDLPSIHISSPFSCKSVLYLHRSYPLRPFLLLPFPLLPILFLPFPLHPFLLLPSPSFPTPLYSSSSHLIPPLTSSSLLAPLQFSPEPLPTSSTQRSLSSLLHSTPHHSPLPQNAF